MTMVKIKYQSLSLYSSGCLFFRKNRIYTGVYNTQQRKRGCKSGKGDEETVSRLKRRTLGLYVRGGSQRLGDASLQPQSWGD